MGEAHDNRRVFRDAGSKKRIRAKVRPIVAVVEREPQPRFFGRRRLCLARTRLTVRNPPPRQGDTADRVVRFMMDQQRRMESAQHFLAEPRNQLNRDTCHVVITGLLVLLGGMHETLRIACELEPRLATLRAEQEGFLNDLESFRHDSAHSADRIFRQFVNARNRNNPDDGEQRLVIAYDPATQTVRTGAERSLVLPEAIARCQRIVGAAVGIVRGGRE
jgi:hypothetical protein